MELKLNKELIRKPVFWAILIPAALLVWTIPAALNMARHGAMKKRALNNIQTVENNAQRILHLLRLSGTDLGTASSEYQNMFTGKDSAFACAGVAGFPESRLTRGESSRNKVLKNGSILHQETYKLHGVEMLQVALFVDHAERYFSNATCDNLTLTFNTRGKTKDTWDASVHIKYIE